MSVPPKVPHSGAREKSDARVWSVLSVRQSVKLPYENLCKLGRLNELGEQEWRCSTLLGRVLGEFTKCQEQEQSVSSSR